MGDESILILTKNGDGMDIKPRNLKITSHREKQKRIFVLKRREPLVPGKWILVLVLRITNRINFKVATVKPNWRQ